MAKAKEEHAELLKDGFEPCWTCGNAIKVEGIYGPRQEGRVRILFPPDEDEVEKNPYLNPALRADEGTDWQTAFIDAGLHDIGNGRRLVLLFGERIRHTAGWGWLVYDGRRWVRDDRGTMHRFAKAVTHNMRELLDDPHWSKYDTDKSSFGKWVKESSGKGRLESMLAMAASEPEVASSVGQFDQHPHLANCRNGIVDMTTNPATLHPHDPGLYLTQLIPHDYVPTATCPRWDQFIDEICVGDRELADYFHRAVGYTFTGDMSEEKLFFAYGNGANGKSKFIGALRHVLGDYGTSLSFEALLTSRTSSPEQGFAHLPGKRFATATEAGGNRSWNQEALTRITGRDTIRGKQLYKDQFEFYPVCKLWVAANNLPRVEDYGEAMWRRLVLLPFLAHFDGDKKDPDLEEKLKAEAEGILAWGIRGAVRWYRERLKVEPAAIRDARNEYRADSDLMGRWISECCLLDPKVSCSARDLYQSYRDFAKDGNEREMTQTAFGSALAKWNGSRLKKSRMHGGRIRWQGLTTTALAEKDGIHAPLAAYGALEIHSPHDRVQAVQDLVRSLAAASERGYALHDDVLRDAAKQGLSVDEAGKALQTLARNNAVYAKGGSGTYAPLNP